MTMVSLIKAFCSFVLLSDLEFLQDWLCNGDELLEHLKHSKSQPETQGATNLVDKNFVFDEDSSLMAPFYPTRVRSLATLVTY